MTSLTTNAFDLPDRLAAKADPALIAADEQHFAAIAASLAQSIADLSDRLEEARKAPGGQGQEALDRDLEVHRLTSRLRTLRRFGLDLCLGHIVSADDPEPVYIGRLGLTDSSGRRLLIDWRSPAAEPFFGATHANPMGLASRRRYRWTRGRISDYWDEVFTADGFAGHAAALDDQSAFVASLGSSRSARMRDVLGTIQADQDAIIRAGSRGALVVDGGPGTGKPNPGLRHSCYLKRGERRRSDTEYLCSPWSSGLSRYHSRMIRAVVFDVGECLINEAREYGTWADWLGVPRHTFSAMFGAVIARGSDYRETFQGFQPGFDLTAERERRAAAGQPEWFGEDDLYSDVRPTLTALRDAGLWVGIAGNQTVRAGGLLRGLDLPSDLIATSDDWGVSKPDSAFFDEVIKRSPFTAEEMLYVGDRLDNDIRPAHAAGLHTALIRRGPWAVIWQDDPDVTRLATMRIDSLAELPELIAAFNAAMR